MVQPATQDADLPLIEALLRGESQALDELVRRHERWVRGVIFGLTGRADLVDDVLQQVWTTVWQQIGTLRDPTVWRSWVYQIARRATIDAARRWKRTRREEVLVDGDEICRFPSSHRPEDRIIADEQHHRMMQAIKSLPAIYREPFVLKHLEGWGYAEIGKVLDLPVDTVETRLVRARRMLRETLQGAV